MRSVNYYQPGSIKEACALLQDLGETAGVLAGGTDVVVRLNKDKSPYQSLVNIKKILGLSYIREETNGIAIGALTKLNEIARDERIKKWFPAFSKAVNAIGTNQIRNLGTLGGNLCNASPCADSVCPLIVFGAVFTLSDGERSRQVPVEQFFTGPGKTILRQGELLSQIFIPFLPKGTRQGFCKLGPRKAADIAIINMAAVLTLDEGDQILEARLAFGSVAPTAIRGVKTEKLLVGKRRAEINLESVGRLAAEEVKPITDVRATLEYRRKMADILSQELISELIREK